MHIVITGGTGFIGQALTRRLLQENRLRLGNGVSTPIDRITIVDSAPPPQRIDDHRVIYRAVDITDRAEIEGAIDAPADCCIHLAAIVSANAEQDFDLGWSVNVDGTRYLLEIMRKQGNRPQFIFASSLAVFGGAMPDVVHDGIALWPQTSYGAQKASGELMVADYARKGFIEGFSLRLPTVVVRPGKPNKAASTFASSIIREPLAGTPAICPVGPDAHMFIASPRAVVSSFVHGLGLRGQDVGTDKAMVLPGLTVSIGEMVQALRDVAGGNVADLVSWKRDPAIEKIVSGWAANVRSDRARDLGFPEDSSFHDIVKAHIEDHAT